MMKEKRPKENTAVVVNEMKAIVDLRLTIQEARMLLLDSVNIDQKEIANELGVTVKSVETHIKKAREKIGKIPGYTKPESDIDGLNTFLKAGVIKLQKKG